MSISAKTSHWTQAWHHHCAALGEPWYVHQSPTPIDAPYPVAFNDDVASLLGLNGQRIRAEGYAELLSGNQLPEDSRPVAHRYGGHQFGVWAGQLGDGRALTLGEIEAPDGTPHEIQLKGAGQTPYSRFGDGRAVLRSTLREYLASEALAGLGIPTTRALAIVGSDAPVYRETVETSAILTRVAPSLVRFGSFEILFYNQQFEALAPLADHVINQHHPELAAIDHDQERYRQWVAHVIQVTAELVAGWQSVGFCHGVLNTDNMSVLGLTLDYGPFGFMEGFDPEWICNHTDAAGRYTYSQQPMVALWNLGRFVQAILPLLADEPDEAVTIGRRLLDAYYPALDAAYLERMRRKLGLPDEGDQDAELVSSLLQCMKTDGADFTRSFRALSFTSTQPDAAGTPFIDEFVDRESATDWLQDWRARLASSGDAATASRVMQQNNPRYILRNYLAENAIQRAQAGDYGELERLHHVLRRPFDEQPEYAEYARLPPEWARGLVLSCSS